MSLEIEKKYRLTPSDRERLTRTLEELGAEFLGSESEENTIFSSEVLRDNGAIVRVRRTDTRVLLTYKRRVETQFDVKQQIEHEVEVSDAESVVAMLHELGLEPRLVYEKRRDTWKFRSVEIVLDELPFGLYMEIEGSVTAIKEAEVLLDADELETEHETYPALTSRLGKQRGNVVEARFD